MKRFFLVLLTSGFVLAATTVIFSKFNRAESSRVVMKEDEDRDEESEDGENEDGILQAQQMEFLMTKDMKLGYIPASRLINAYNELYEARKSGRINSRLTSLSWTERGPNTDVVGPSNGNTRGAANNAVTGGRTRAIWVDLADVTNRTVWVGSVSGGLWKTTDITATPANWTVVNDFIGNLAIASIAQDPTNTNVMYLGTGEKTFNVDAVRGGGVWKSTDHGVTWTLLPSTTGFWNISKIVCDNSGYVYVGTLGSGSGLQRSKDGGVTWTEITPSSPQRGSRITDVRISNTGRMHVTKGYSSTAGQSGYFYTDNPGTVDSVTWNSPITAFSNVQYNCEITVSGNTLYALPTNSSSLTPQIYKSIDGGLTWTGTLTSPPSTASEPSINTGQGWYDLAIGIDPNNSDNVLAGGLNFYRSSNGGITWTQVSRWVGSVYSYVHADHHNVAWNGTQVLVGTDGGIFYSSDNGNNFTDRNVGLRIKQFYSCAIHPTSTNYFLAGAQDNGTHQLNSAGLSGSTEVTGGDGAFVHIDEDEPQYQFGSYVYNQYRRSVNGGSTWSAVNYSSSIGQFINPSDYDDVNNNMYASGNAGTYVRWDNAPASTTFKTVSISSASSGSVMSLKVSPFENNAVYLGLTDGRVVKVTNANLSTATATNITGTGMPGSTVSSINTGTSANYLLATYSNYGAAHVWMSSTGGGTSGWTNISGNLPDIPVRWAMFFPEDNDKAMVATDMGIFETNDINGASTVWVQNTGFPSVRTNMFQYRWSDNTVVAATHGRGLWTSTFTPAAPYVRFASSYNYMAGTEATSATGNVCRNYKDYTVKMHIDKAPTGTANVTLNIAGGTATQGVDYDITTNGDFTNPSTTLSFASGATTDQSFTVRIYNDADLENTEYFTIGYTIGGGTNAVAAPSSQSYTFNIYDNDVAPSAPSFSGSYSFGTFEVNLTSATPLRSNMQRFRVQYLFTASELAAAGITGAGNISALSFNVSTKSSTQPFAGFTVSMGNTSASNLTSGFVSPAFTQVYTGNYTSVSGINTIQFSTPFAWDGTSNVVLNFCFDNGTAPVDALPDVVDGAASPLGSSVAAAAYSSATTGSGCSLSSSNTSASRIAVTFTAGSGNPIATILNSSKTESVLNNGSYYFYNLLEVINSLSNASASLGCVTSTISEAGNTWQSFYSGQRSQKVYNISVSQNSSATYTLGLYYTADELASKTPSTLKIVKTTAASGSLADISNSTLIATTSTAYGSGYLFTATVSGSGRFFLAEDNVSGLFDMSRRENFVKLLQNPVSFSIPMYVSNPQREKVAASLFTNTGQLIQKWDLGRTDNYTQMALNGKVTSGVYILRVDAGNKTQTIKIVKQ